MLRWLATALLLALLALDIALPSTPLGRRGRDAIAKLDVDGAFAAVGAPLPDGVLDRLETFDGRPLSALDFRGHPTIVTFERSVDW